MQELKRKFVNYVGSPEPVKITIDQIYSNPKKFIITADNQIKSEFDFYFQALRQFYQI